MGGSDIGVVCNSLGVGRRAIGITSPEWTAWGRKRIAFPPRRPACATASEGIGGVNHQAVIVLSTTIALRRCRLEDEQREFKEFLKRLRVARDRAEFDQFMNDRHLDAPQRLQTRDLVELFPLR